jgi:hypothetical protein
MVESPYADPELRAQVVAEIKKGTKGGKKDQWSARKSQFATVEYEKRFAEKYGDKSPYTGPRTESQRKLVKWGDENWTTRDGKKAIRKDSQGDMIVKRYLPAKAWENLTPEEARATDVKKVKGKGQFVKNTQRAAAESKKARAYSKLASIPFDMPPAYKAYYFPTLTDDKEIEDSIDQLMVGYLHYRSGGQTPPADAEFNVFDIADFVGMDRDKLDDISQYVNISPEQTEFTEEDIPIEVPNSLGLTWTMAVADQYGDIVAVHDVALEDSGILGFNLVATQSAMGGRGLFQGPSTLRMQEPQWMRYSEQMGLGDDRSLELTSDLMDPVETATLLHGNDVKVISKRAINLGFGFDQVRVSPPDSELEDYNEMWTRVVLDDEQGEHVNARDIWSSVPGGVGGTSREKIEAFAMDYPELFAEDDIDPKASSFVDGLPIWDAVPDDIIDSAAFAYEKGDFEQAARLLRGNVVSGSQLSDSPTNRFQSQWIDSRLADEILYAAESDQSQAFMDAFDTLEDTYGRRTAIPGIELLGLVEDFGDERIKARALDYMTALMRFENELNLRGSAQRQPEGSRVSQAPGFRMGDRIMDKPILDGTNPYRDTNMFTTPSPYWKERAFQRRINGQTYVGSKATPHARRIAEIIRIRGRNARVIPTKAGLRVYVGPRKTR